MHALKPASLILALTALYGSGAHAGINVPVTQTCDTSRAPSAYLATPSGSIATLPQLVGPARMTPCFIQTDMGSSEPNLAIRKDGTLVYAPIHFPNGDIGVMRSKDNGYTWDATVPLLANGKPHNRVQPYMFQEPQSERLIFTSSRASFSPLALTTGMNVSISDDGGDTWRSKTLDQYKGIDWIKIAAGPGKTSTPVGAPQVLYLSGPTPISTPAIIVEPLQHQVLKSLDGGETWTEAGSFNIKLTDNGCSIADYILYGTNAVTSDGTIYIGGRRCTKVAVASSKDEGKTWTVTDVPNTKLLAGATTAAIALNPNYVLTQPLTADSAGNLYVLYADDKNLLRLTVSKNKGASWSQPIVISAPKVQKVYLTSLTVKAPGQIAIAYYGSEDGTKYNGYVAESSNLFSLTPVFKSQFINPPTAPLFTQGFDANYIGMFVGGDLAEVTQVRYAPNGDLYISLVQDMCPGGTSCNWDFAAHFKSRFRALLGRITH